ncbi:hypothetical protein [Sporomusa carbonis]|uniref:prenylated flavin chaperone LpdD n=1 Tax=Sporomusa carbonis TaxID=3076075 RepID=UPI003C7BD3A9
MTINLRAIPMGSQWNVAITGGKAHIGAVALGIPRSSLADPGQASASVSVLTVTGHIDDEVARPAAHFLAKALKQIVVVSCGIHYDKITAEDILVVKKLVQEILEDFYANVHE